MKDFGDLHLALRSRKFIAATILLSLFVLSGQFATVNGRTGQDCGLGTVWNEYEVGGWNGTWTRRGNSSTFDAVFRLSGEPDVTSVLNISISGNSVHISRTDSPNRFANHSCIYEGKIGSDGVSVSGTYSCVRDDGTKTDTYSWKATIRCSRGCGLGAKWRVTDGGWSGIWTRRGNSNLFDAVWTREGQQFTAVLTINMNGNRVNVKRRNSTLGGDCELNGTLGADGLTVTGTNICTQGRGDIQAKIECQ